MIHQLLRHPRALRTRAALLAATGAVLALAACEGDNLFEGRVGTSGGPPQVIEVIAPQMVAEHARVDVRVRAIAPRGMAKINIRFRGATADDREFTNATASKDTVTVDAALDLPLLLADSVLRVEAFATDATGAVSDIVTATVRIVDASAPAVTADAQATKASMGSTFELHVTATDAFGLQQLGYAFVTSQKDTVLSALVTASGAARDTTFRIPIPTSLKPGDVSVVALAVNRANLRGVSAPLALTLVDSLAPTIAILEPAEGESFPLTDSIRVRVRAQDASGIQSISIRGISFRFFPDSSRNSYPVVRFPEVSIPLPQGPDRPLTTDTTVFRFLHPAADTVSEPVYLIVRVADAFGNVAVDTVRITPGPRVTIVNPANGTTARVGSTIPVRVSAYDPAGGLDSLKLYVQGVRQDSFVFKDLLGARDPVERNVLLDVGPQAGALQLTAAVWNSLGVRGGTSVPVTVNVTNATTGAPPKVRREFYSNDRVELGDSIRVHVTATDAGGAGIVRIGAVVIAIPANESGTLRRDTFYLSTPTFAQPRGGTPDTTFVLYLRDAYSEVSTARFPLPFTFQVHAFALDSQNRCGASVQETDQDLACRLINGSYYVAEGQTGVSYNATAVVGTSRALPARSIIADALPDTLNDRVYLSNYSNNQVNVLQLADTSFRTVPLPVGSQPWGLFLAPGPDGRPESLMVANSGGTNISFVPTSVPTSSLREDPSRRILTPNEILFEVKESVANGFIRYIVKELEFSDRPQFVAKDRLGNVLYSTRPTSAAIEGTARVAPVPPDSGVYEPIIIIPGRSNAIKEGGDNWAIAHVDSIVVVPSVVGDQYIVIYDHIPGRPDQRISSIAGYAGAAILDIVNKGSDIFAAGGTWNRAGVGFSDTTYVAYSKDLGTIAFGEGDKAPYGRILLWSVPSDGGSPRISSTGTYDLIANAAEEVTGIALNGNGQLGVARGLISTYFFTNNVQMEGELRLNGVFSAGAAGGSGGVALHQNHVDGSAGSNDSTIAFIATPNRSIKIVDTFHYIERGEIFIRDNISGQLRASKPLGNVNAGVAPSSCNYIVTQLFGVTTGNNLLLVSVRRRDIRDVNSGQPNCNPNL